MFVIFVDKVVLWSGCLDKIFIDVIVNSLWICFDI